MNRSSHTQISDELLSAYIDGLVTNEERSRIEAAVAADPALAWELDSLRRTVELVRDLPPVTLPRSFALREEQVADVLAARRARQAGSAAGPGPAARPALAARSRNFWQEFLAFFNGGNLFLRNATAVAALFLVIVLVVTPSGPQADQDTAQSPAAEFSAAAPESPVVSAESAEFTSPVEPASSQPDSAAKAAPVESGPAVAAPLNEMAAPAPVQTQADAAAMESVPPSAMRSAPSGLDAPAFAGPTGGGMGGGFESGPMARPLVPEEMAPAGASPFPADGAGLPPDGGPQYSLKLPAESEASAPAAADSSQVEPAPVGVAAEGPVAENAVAQDSNANAPAAKEAEMPAQAEVLVEPLPQQPLPQQSVQSGWTIWRLAQAGLGGLVLLLGLLWLRSRQPYL